MCALARGVTDRCYAEVSNRCKESITQSANITVFPDMTPCSLTDRYRTFRRILLPISSQFDTLKTEAEGCSEALVHIYKTTRRNILEYSNVRTRRSKSLAFHIQRRLKPIGIKKAPSPVKFEVIEAVLVFWYVTLCMLQVKKRFGVMYFTYLQDRRVSEANNQEEPSNNLKPPLIHFSSPVVLKRFWFEEHCETYIHFLAHLVYNIKNVLIYFRL
jgi:hypothetical protein